MEIERKFLVERLPDGLAHYPAHRIEQGYLALDESSGAEVRVRRHGEDLVLTVKGAGDLSRVEVELPLSREQFDSLWPLGEGRRVEKTRHELPGGIELDVYGGALDGLIVAEIEFPSEADSEAFEPPSWLGREVTEDRRYKNRALAVDGRPTRTLGRERRAGALLEPLGQLARPLRVEPAAHLDRRALELLAPLAHGAVEDAPLVRG